MMANIKGLVKSKTCSGKIGATPRQAFNVFLDIP